MQKIYFSDGKRKSETGNYRKIAEIFVGILMHLSLVKLPQRRRYWSSQPRQENITSYMTCNRLEQDLMIFHLSDNELQPKPGSSNYNKLYKGEVLLSSLKEIFKKYASPEIDMCVDEQMVRSKDNID